MKEEIFLSRWNLEEIRDYMLFMCRGRNLPAIKFVSQAESTGVAYGYFRLDFTQRTRRILAIRLAAD